MDMIVMPDLSDQDIPDFKMTEPEEVVEKVEEIKGAGIHTNDDHTVEQYFAYYSKLYN